MDATVTDLRAMSDAELVNSLMVKSAAVLMAKLFGEADLEAEAKALVKAREAELLQRLSERLDDSDG
jgi:predicted ATP-grasp superfamily ATP-dependent carboligase